MDSGSEVTREGVRQAKYRYISIQQDWLLLKNDSFCYLALLVRRKGKASPTDTKPAVDAGARPPHL